MTQARTWALRRLMGAAVLLLLGLVLFPLIFETKPRPLPMDLHITVAPGTVAPVAGAPAPARPVAPMIIETAEPELTAAAVAPASTAPLPTAPPRLVASTVPAVALAPAPVPAAKAVPTQTPTPTPTPTPESKVSAPAMAASSPAAYPTAARFVVQVGTFSDDATVRQARLKVEKLGLKTYTQGLSTDAGRRVRVRVGPFATRDEAAQVLNKLKGAGLPGAVLAL